MKGTAYGIGYIIGMLVIIPIIMWVFNSFILVGNNATEQEIKEFIKNSYTDTIVEIPETIYISNNEEFDDLSSDQLNDFKKCPSAYTKNTFEKYWARLARGNSTGFMDSYTFYSKKYKKYLSVKTFDITDKYDTRHRDMIFNENPTFTVHINKDLLKDTSYGTQENPLPIFARELIAEGGVAVTHDKKYFYISDTLNFIFVREYLNHFLDEEKFNKIFREK